MYQIVSLSDIISRRISVYLIKKFGEQMLSLEESKKYFHIKIQSYKKSLFPIHTTPKGKNQDKWSKMIFKIATKIHENKKWYRKLLISLVWNIIMI